jgi:hypothetical protein
MAVLAQAELLAIKGKTEPQRNGDQGGSKGKTSMIIVTSEHVAGYKVTETKGQVFGLVVRSRGLGGNVLAGLRSIVGG